MSKSINHKENKKYFELNENNISKIIGCNKRKTLKFVPLNACIRKEGKSQISNLRFHLKDLEKEEQIQPKVARKKT